MLSCADAPELGLFLVEKENLMRSLPKLLIVVLVLGSTALIGWQIFGSRNSAPSGAPTQFVLPELSATALRGQAVFDAVCAACHGKNALGSDKGPPLIHPIYNPGHHGDEAFYRAVRMGSPQHHWRFGDMPPQTSVSTEQVAEIIAYVRETQRANGIVYQEHRM